MFNHIKQDLKNYRDANSVILIDVPDDVIAVGVPAVVKMKKPHL